MNLLSVFYELRVIHDFRMVYNGERSVSAARRRHMPVDVNVHAVMSCLGTYNAGTFFRTYS